jgi:hypothetical protein
MSRSQQGQVYNTTQANAATDTTNSAASQAQAQADIGANQAALSKFQSSNPYQAGGEFQTTQNQQLADTAAGVADSTKQAVEGASVRTGANVGGAVAGAEEAAQQAQRTLGGQEANANQTRIGDEAGYNETALSAGNTIEGQQDTLAQQQAQQAQGETGTEEQAANTPSFSDMLGQGLISAGTSFAGGFGGAVGKAAMGCWVAAELYGGWDEPRTVLVREWLHNEFKKRWYGAPLVAAYMRFGERIAARIKTARRLRAAFQVVFDAALRRAEAARKEVR